MNPHGERLLSWTLQDMQPRRPYRRPALERWGGRAAFAVVCGLAGAGLLLSVGGAAAWLGAFLK